METTSIRQAFRGAPYQSAAIFVCVLLGLAMIANTQWGGEAMWFWYASAFHAGAKLYSGLHTPLQPLFVLETDVWMQLFGTKCLLLEIPSVFHLLALCLGIFLVLRESDWPDWQKALIFIGAFALFATGHSYRFDDYHVVAECFILYSLIGLLWVVRAQAAPQQLSLAAALGVLSGLTITTRLTDGAALFVVTGFSLSILLRNKRVLSISLFVAAASLTAILIVKLTGDSFSSYISNTIIKAAGSKGGTGSLLADPFMVVLNTLKILVNRKRLIVWLCVTAAAGLLLQRYGRKGARSIILVQLGIAAATFCVATSPTRDNLLGGFFISAMVLILILVTYLLAAVIAARFMLSHIRPVQDRKWDRREILGLLPLAIWASYSAGAGAEPLTQYYAPFAMLLLLVPVLQPFRGCAAWANASFVTMLALLGLSGITSKILLPYSWQNYRYGPMFVNRQWYRHPVYGPLYIDRDLLRFSLSVCSEIGEKQIGQGPRPELLSLPYPYPNYFCATPPWKGYVQTFFDTSTRATIDHLIDQLKTAPPQWIVYQRQLGGLAGSERLYNHGHPWPQRTLDELIMQKISTGQWLLVEKKNYLQGDGWFIIRTHP